MMKKSTLKRMRALVANGRLKKLFVGLCVALLAGCRPAPEFTFASWNIGHFALGKRAVSGIPEKEAAEKAETYRAFLAEVGADVFGVAEYSSRFTCDGTTATERAVFGTYDGRFVGPHHNYQWNACFWKDFTCLSTNVVSYPKHDQDVYYVATRLNVAGVEIVFVETHLDWRTFLPGHEDDRRLQMRKLIDDLKDEPRVVIAGDFNVGIREKGKKTRDNPDEYRVFAEAGYTLGNDGRYKTYPAGRLAQPEGSYALDNILVKGLTILEFRVFDRPDLSDHALVRARLRVDAEASPRVKP